MHSIICWRKYWHFHYTGVLNYMLKKRLTLPLNRCNLLRIGGNNIWWAEKQNWAWLFNLFIRPKVNLSLSHLQLWVSWGFWRSEMSTVTSQFQWHRLCAVQTTRTMRKQSYQHWNTDRQSRRTDPVQWPSCCTWTGGSSRLYSVGAKGRSPTTEDKSWNWRANAGNTYIKSA